MIISESYFGDSSLNGDISINDIGVTIHSINNLPTYEVMWHPAYNITLQNILSYNLQKLTNIISNTFYIQNAKIMLSGDKLYLKYPNLLKDENDVIDFTVLCRYLINNDIDDNIVEISDIHIFFDLSNESYKTNVKYLVGILKELSEILVIFVKLIKMTTKYYDTLILETNNRTKPRYGFFVKTLIYLFLNGIANNGMCQYFVKFFVAIFNTPTKKNYKSISEADFNNKEIKAYLQRNKNTFTHNLLANGLPLKILHRLIIQTNAKTGMTDVFIPEGKHVCLNGVVLREAADSTEYEHKVRLYVDGTLIINDISDYSNLKTLVGGYLHNKLTIKTLVTPSILRFMLMSCKFKTIDFTNAELTEDIDINMNFKYIINPDVNIIPDKENKLNIIR